jgi:hypothetical protein
MALISGTENFNWEELEETVEYKVSHLTTKVTYHQSVAVQLDMSL